MNPSPTKLAQSALGPTDRELLEAAAKAAGYVNLVWTEGASPIVRVPFRAAEKTYWNPLTDDGDALRLVVKLRLHLGCEDRCVSAWDKDQYGNFKTEGFAQHESEGAATRRAIVRAAAELGRATGASTNE